ncbi:unnamed protein product, partial [Prorocentrum cordatum]
SSHGSSVPNWAGSGLRAGCSMAAGDAPAMRGTVPDEHSREDSYVGHWVRAHIGDRGVLDSQPQALQGDGRDTAVLLKGVEPSGSLVRRKSVESEEDSREKAKYTDSFVGKIVVSKAFELLTIGVIILNAMAIGWDIDFTARWRAMLLAVAAPVM